jgi:hypothetical protein
MGRRPPYPPEVRERELRRAKEIRQAASAFFARELDPQPPKR